MFFHSSSYTANPIACAAAAANIAIWRDEPVLERVTGLARQQSSRLEALAMVPGVHNPRILGTIAALELGGGEGTYLSELGPQLLRFFRDRDLLLRPLGNTVYVMPPYCIDDADLDAIYEAAAAAAGVVNR
jgi:adenosylmethionine---8-amino-7-oxononanoate aminotransferase